MARNFKELRDKLDERLDTLGAEGEEIRARVSADLDEEIAAHERTLADLRKARQLTQAQLARSLGVSQAQVSRIESQADLYLSTLQSYIEAMGGRLEILGVFGDETRTRVPLTVGELGGGGIGREVSMGPPDLMAALEASLRSTKTTPSTREQLLTALEDALEDLKQHDAADRAVAPPTQKRAQSA